MPRSNVLRTSSLWAAVGLATLFPLAITAEATEGYFQHGYGIRSKSMGGAAVAFSQDALSQATNPAGLVNVDSRIDAGINFFSPRREVTGSAPGFIPNRTVESENELFLIPEFGLNYRIDDVSAVGIALYGNGGMNTEYDAVSRNPAICGPGGSGVFCGGKAGVDLVQLFVQPTYAREIFDGVSLGAGPIFAVQRFEAKGLSAFGPFSSDPGNLTNNGHDLSYGFGGRFGLQVELPANVNFGAAYQMRTFMTEFDDYAGLFAEQGDFDIPPALQVGLSWQPIPEVTLAFDYRRIWFSDIDAVGNSGPPIGPGNMLGTNNGAGFGWDDADIFKVGVQWKPDDHWTLRAGYSYTDQPIDSSEVLFNILAPAVMEHHITAGIEYEFDEHHSVQFGGFFAPNSKVSGANPISPGQNIDLEMHQFEVSVGYSYRF